MIIGVPKEIKNHEYRVGLVPASVRELTARGHKVVIETQAGAGIGLDDLAYIQAGASIVLNAQQVYENAQLIVKVKEPQASEYAWIQAHHTLFTYLHLAADPQQTEALLASGALCIAYETVTDKFGGLPLLAPMSEVAGRFSIQAGAQALERTHQGSGMLLGGVPGVAPAKVTILGGGVVGSNAAQMALGLGANVSILDKNLQVLRQLNKQFGRQVNLILATEETLDKYITQANLVIGGVLIPGASAPKLIQRKHLSQMQNGSVIVDVAIDQGGCAETSRPTTHQDPMFVVDGVVHYCVANMPGAVAQTAAFALNNATLPYVLKLADLGSIAALLADTHLQQGVNIMAGELTHAAIASAQQRPYRPIDALLATH